MTHSVNCGAELAGRSFERILLIKPSSFGDVIHALPVLHGLRRRFPRARIEWLLASPFVPFLEEHPELDAVVPFDRRRYGRMARNPRAAAEFVRFARDLRSRAYDLVIDLQGLFRSGFLAWVSGAPVRIGFQDARELARWFYTHRLGTDGSDVHAVERNLRVARLLGFADTPIEFPAPVPPSARTAAAELLRSVGRTGAESWAVVAPGARWETKRWAPNRFAELIDALRDRLGVRSVLVGSAEESELCARLAAGCRGPVANLAGRTNVATLAAIVEASDLVVAHDSAVMHLAVALDRPLVCIIGPTNHRRTGPYQRPGDVVRLDLDCAPCYFRRLSQCPHQHRCMEDLAASTVLAAAERALRAQAAAAAR